MVDLIFEIQCGNLSPLKYWESLECDMQDILEITKQYENISDEVPIKSTISPGNRFWQSSDF